MHYQKILYNYLCMNTVKYIKVTNFEILYSANTCDDAVVQINGTLMLTFKFSLDNVEQIYIIKRMQSNCFIEELGAGLQFESGKALV